MSKILDYCIKNNIDCLDITYFFKKGDDYKIYITIPYKMDHDAFITFLLGY